MHTCCSFTSGVSLFPVGVGTWVASMCLSSCFDRGSTFSARTGAQIWLFVNGSHSGMALYKVKHIRRPVERCNCVLTALIPENRAVLQGRLTSANIGDSGFLVLGTSRQDQHEMELRHHSPQQEHQFGFPYQLGHHEGADTVDSAMLHTQPVTSGDVIILGSDGLWDNVSVHEISETVKAMTARASRPSAIAQQLTKLAFEHALDKHAVTPYSAAASEAFDMIYSGGKQDDITVIVTQLH